MKKIIILFLMFYVYAEHESIDLHPAHNPATQATSATQSDDHEREIIEEQEELERQEAPSKQNQSLSGKSLMNDDRTASNFSQKLGQKK